MAYTGSFYLVGVKYGLAISLTILLATCVGLAGWARIAVKTGAPPFVEFLFVMALAAFQFNTGGGRSGGFLNYHGGEVLLFAAAPWSLLALLKCVDARPLIAFGGTLSVAVLLFVMKLTGLVVFATTVLALSAVDIARRWRVSGSILAMGSPQRWQHSCSRPSGCHADMWRPKHRLSAMRLVVLTCLGRRFSSRWRLPPSRHCQVST